MLYDLELDNLANQMHKARKVEADKETVWFTD